jgi:hypothetical protein
MARGSVGRMTIWKGIGYAFAILLAFLVAGVAVTAMAIGIACLVNHVSFADQFFAWFPYFKQTTEAVVHAAIVLPHL